MNEVFKIRFKFWQNDKVDQGLSLWNEGASVFTISAIMTLNPDDNSCDTLKKIFFYFTKRNDLSIWKELPSFCFVLFYLHPS